jgi:TRAP transporter TAXI family solute receptor
MRRVSCSVAIAVIAAAIGCWHVHPASAQQRKGEPVVVNKEKMNENTVAIISGKSSSSYLPLVEDLTAVLDNGDNLRILAVVGKGPAQNVKDALFLRNMDMGITQSNILAHFKKSGELGPNIEQRLVFITKLFNEEVHIISGPNTTKLQDLAGKTVNFGEVGAGADLTARAIFEALKISVTPVHISHADAMHRIRSGEIAASILVAGKPVGALERLKDAGDFRLLSVPFEDALEADYLPAKLTHEDYPDLIPQGENIQTIAVSAVLAAYNWAPGGDRGRRLSKFVEAFFSNFAELRKEPRHPKWREVNLLAEVPGWQRLPAAKTWLEQRVAQSGQANRVAAQAVPTPRNFQDFLASQRQAGVPLTGPAAEQALFKKFMEWMQTNNQAAAPGKSPPTPVSEPAVKASGTRLW